MHKVLIVDSEYLNREALKVMIEKLDSFQVVGQVETSKELLTLSKQLSPDIILMDMMPFNSNSIELLKAIREINSKVAIFILSVCNDAKLIQQAKQIGIDGYLVKPFTVLKLKTILSNYEKTRKNPFYAEALTQSIVKKDFEKTYRILPRMAQDLLDLSATNPEAALSECEFLLEVFLKLINCVDEKYKMRYKRKFSIQENTFENVYTVEYWLFTIVDEAYKQLSIQKYHQLARVFSYTDENIELDISLNETSRICEISQGYLSRIFKRQFTIGFNNYIHFRKMQLAKLYFTRDNLSVTDISFQLDYNDVSYFCKVFKRIEGYTPAQLKKIEMKMKQS
ncbi:MAG: response regulator [Anaerobacillus sp.]|uniref:response regulator n=1 Tax=Anaerobacillus sp. TaxID=1872506 RepID=UPI003919BCF6